MTYLGLEEDRTHPTAAKYLKTGYGGLVGFGIKADRNQALQQTVQ